jgi:hypothetical protein
LVSNAAPKLLDLGQLIRADQEAERQRLAREHQR